MTKRKRCRVCSVREVARARRHEHPDRQPAAERPQLLRAGAAHARRGAAARRRQPAAHPRELHLGHRGQRRARQPDDLHARRRRRHRPSPGRLADPDVGRRAAGVQGAAERLLRRVQPGGRRAERDHQVGRRTSCTARSSTSCATTPSTRGTSSRSRPRS